MILFEGGDGTAIDKAIEITGATNSIEGVSSEYKHLTQRFGQKDVDYTVEGQALLNENGKYFDKITIKLKDNSLLDLYFDISDFFGKI